MTLALGKIGSWKGEGLLVSLVHFLAMAEVRVGKEIQIIQRATRLDEKKEIRIVKAQFVFAFKKCIARYPKLVEIDMRIKEYYRKEQKEPVCNHESIMQEGDFH